MKLHFIGIGGAGMSGLAKYALARGYRVSGSDARRSSRIDDLEALGATVILGHSPANLGGAEIVVRSSAVPPHNPELVAAHERGLDVLRRGELLARFVAEHPAGIAICGTHGKGTTAGALVEVLEAAGHRVSYILGAPRRSTGRRAHYDAESEFFVAEVDESDRTHEAQSPRHLLVTNLEADHLNIYGSLSAIVDSFAELVTRFRAQSPDGSLVLGQYGAGIEALMPRVRSANPLTSGDGAVVRAEGVAPSGTGMRFDLVAESQLVCSVETPLTGELNVRNLVAAAALALDLSIPSAALAEGLARYQGLTDRFHVFDGGRCPVVTDYTSHPTSIRGNIAALRARTQGRVFAVFQPYRYSLLSHFWDEYAEALAGADAVFLAPLDPGGEPAHDGISEASLAAAIEARGASALVTPDLAAIEAGLDDRTNERDGVIVFGGGPLFDMARRIAALNRRP